MKRRRGKLGKNTKVWGSQRGVGGELYDDDDGDDFCNVVPDSLIFPLMHEGHSRHGTTWNPEFAEWNGKEKGKWTLGKVKLKMESYLLI